MRKMKKKDHRNNQRFFLFAMPVDTLMTFHANHIVQHLIKTCQALQKFAPNNSLPLAKNIDEIARAKKAPTNVKNGRQGPRK